MNPHLVEVKGLYEIALLEDGGFVANSTSLIFRWAEETWLTKVSAGMSEMVIPRADGAIAISPIIDEMYVDTGEHLFSHGPVLTQAQTIGLAAHIVRQSATSSHECSSTA